MQPTTRLCVLTFLLASLGCMSPTFETGGAHPAGMLAGGFEVAATIDVGAAPHGILFSEEGRLAYVALSGDDELAVINCASLEVLRKLPAGKVPLDVLALADGATGAGASGGATTEGRLLVTEFRAATLRQLAEGGEVWNVGKGPSLFAPQVVNGLAYLACEFADELVVFDTRTGEVRERHATGDRPYPAAVTRDGVLAFVPNKDENTVSVIDLLNKETAASVPVGTGPTGGALLNDETTYVVACGGSDELVWINTASFEEVGRTAGVGPGPFSVAATPDGRFLIVNNSGGSTLSIVSVATRKLVGEVQVGEQPIVVRMHPNGHQAWVSNELSGTLSILELPAQPRGRPAGDALNELVVVGTIHSGHLESERYSLDLLRELVRAVQPDLILAEIPPNRAAEAMRGFRADAVVSEPRVLRFPEYVSVIYPLLNELHFEIVPTAGWNEPMARFRSERLKAIEADPERAADWLAYTEANAASDACLEALGEGDEPLLIHSDAYDDCADVALAVYDALFNEELGPGGWTQINEAHYGHIAAALDAHRGEGLRVLITYGAGHKGWFLRELRKRGDITLLPVAPFLDEALWEMDEP